MAKPKRMSEMFAASSATDASTTMAMTTPPYSSEGPTLPIIDALDDARKLSEATKASKKRKAHEGCVDTTAKKPSHTTPPRTIHPSLYEPWTRLPPDLHKLLETKTRLRGAQNVIPVVFSKNQNVKSGITRLKTYLGADRGSASSIEIPDASKHEDLVIAVSAQGEGTAKLVSIVDMVQRLVAPSGKDKDDKTVETWWMYTQLSSVEAKRTVKTGNGHTEGIEERTGPNRGTEEEEAFEPTNLGEQNTQGTVPDKDAVQMRRVPVLTVWMTRKKIPEFRKAFGEQTFPVQKIPQEHD
ncbi:hypothetical protein BDW02DRAFT_231341 [Decorospora gaudefroyi]|uniref:DNA/RNA-binding protein Alba-like domain-containing protein n=1 Tax=Decorospora gaudefroyi TaxID=184978 RepID=A0A6A5KSL7_9PLEO|nr:hypothetical protein BDW02DRAFT_231341 [Decorospora gaudefroyi]